LSAPRLLSSFRHLWPARHWRERAGLAIVFWSLVSALCLAFALLLGALLVDLAVHRGRVTIAAGDAQRFATVFDGVVTLPRPIGSAEVTRENTGLLPTVWRGRDRWWFAAAARVWRRCEWLQTNNLALCSVLATAVALLLLRVFANSRVRLQSAAAAADAALGLRRSIHRQAMRLGPSDLAGGEQRTAVELFTDATAQVRDQLQEYLGQIVRRPATLIILLGVLLLLDWRLALQCLAPLAAIGWMLARERELRDSIRAKAEAEVDAELRPLTEALRKTRLVRAFSMEEFEHTQFQKHLRRHSEGVLRGRLGETWALRTTRAGVVLLGAVIVLLLMARMLSERSLLPVAAAALVVWLLLGIGRAGLQCAVLQSLRKEIEAGASRIYRYLAAAPEVSQAVGAKFLNPMANSIIFEAITYRYRERTLLDRLDLRIMAGTRVALISDDPLMARAVAYLLPRFLEPQSGRILYDSEDIAWATLESLRAETIFVGADDPFFTGTVLENLSCGEAKYSLQDVIEACKQTHAHKAIAGLANGYETLLGEHGEQLPAGVAFRLGLARAILRNPAVLILEEPSERLDENDKALIDDAYQRVLKNRTVIFLPARLSTIKGCRQVVYLRDGVVEASAAHEDLVRSCEAYRHWEYLHFSALSRRTV
jgi:ATP-binding cassette subfamily B protein